MNLLISIDYPPLGGGQGRYSEAFFNSGDYFLITTKSNNRLNIPQKMYQTYFSFLNHPYFIFDAFRVFCMNSILRKASVIHTNGIDGLLFLLFKRKRTKYVTTIHNSYLQRKAANQSSFLKNCIYFLLMQIEKIIIARSDVVICVSENTKNYVAKYNLSTALYVIENGVDTKKFHKKKSKKDVNSCNLLFMGRLEKRKGVLETAMFFHSFLMQYTGTINLKLHIVGSGGLYKNLETFIQNKNLENSIILYGYQNNVASYYQLGDILVLLSKGEGLPLVILEALSSGLKILATKDAIGYSARIEKLPGVYIVEDNFKEQDFIDGVNELVHTEKWYDTHDLVEKIDWKNVIQGTQKLYK